nr:vegetative cell wall protein gp1-like [Aegilops tauschii subsp. strangulata]
MTQCISCIYAALLLLAALLLAHVAAAPSYLCIRLPAVIVDPLDQLLQRSRAAVLRVISASRPHLRGRAPPLRAASANPAPCSEHLVFAHAPGPAGCSGQPSRLRGRLPPSSRLLRARGVAATRLLPCLASPARAPGSRGHGRCTTTPGAASLRRPLLQVPPSAASGLAWPPPTPPPQAAGSDPSARLAGISTQFPAPAIPALVRLLARASGRLASLPLSPRPPAPADPPAPSAPLHPRGHPAGLCRALRLRRLRVPGSPPRLRQHPACASRPPLLTAAAFCGQKRTKEETGPCRTVKGPTATAEKKRVTG